MSGFRSDIKILVMGLSSSGKKNFVNRWTKNIFQDTYKATIVEEFGFKIYEKDGKLYRIQFWDLAGSNENSMIIQVFSKDAHGLLIVSDATNIQLREEYIEFNK